MVGENACFLAVNQLYFNNYFTATSSSRRDCMRMGNCQILQPLPRYVGSYRKYSFLTSVIVVEEMKRINRRRIQSGVNNIYNGFYITGKLQTPVKVSDLHNNFNFSWHSRKIHDIHSEQCCGAQENQSLGVDHNQVLIIFTIVFIVPAWQVSDRNNNFTLLSTFSECMYAK